MDQIPIWLTVNNRGVLVAGGGGVAAAKARIATNAGAMVTVVAPSLGPEIQALVNAGVARHVARKFEAGDVDGQALVFGATGIEQVDAAVAAAAHTVNVPVNIPDHPDLSDFIMPAIVDRGPVVVGISTGGAAPALARQIRGKIESILPARLGDLALLAKDFRQTVKAKIPRGLARLRFWDGLFDGPVADAVLAGDERSAQRHFLRSLNAGDAQSDPAGSVHVVGAGPGDPELLTLRALRLIQTADVVVYDRLVSPEILDFARRDAERINVGKAPGNHAMAQDQINQVLVSQAKLGMRVVRLKGGDPFVFGRGGEEVDFIQSHGIDTSVVPGITAALACAAAAGIPLTHRQSSSAVTFLTGHGADGGDTDHDWAALAKFGHTVAVYMGVASAGQIAANLIGHGMRPELPVAIIENGTRDRQRVFAGRLDALADLILSHQIESPALIIIGEVARSALATHAEPDVIRAVVAG